MLENYEFKDVLVVLLEENGGLSRDNLARISQLIRTLKPDFSLGYLDRLIRGHPPSDEDRIAISRVLDPPSKRWMSKFWKAEDANSRRLAEIASDYTKNPLMAKQLVDSFSLNVRFRNETFNSYEVQRTMAEIFDKRKWDDELDLFYDLS